MNGSMCMEKNNLTEKLKKIAEEDLIFENVPFKDRINTELELRDYDWMTYVLSTSFRTKTQGELKVRFEYLGVVESQMYVEQHKKGLCKEYVYSFSSDIFENYLIKFMTGHLAQWENEDVFYGGDIVLEFYNEIMEKGYLDDRY